MLAHGVRDRITDPARSLAWAELAYPVAGASLPLRGGAAPATRCSSGSASGSGWCAGSRSASLGLAPLGDELTAALGAPADRADEDPACDHVPRTMGLLTAAYGVSADRPARHHPSSRRARRHRRRAPALHHRRRPRHRVRHADRARPGRAAADRRAGRPRSRSTWVTPRRSARCCRRGAPVARSPPSPSAGPRCAPPRFPRPGHEGRGHRQRDLRPDGCPRHRPPRQRRSRSTRRTATSAATRTPSPWPASAARSASTPASSSTTGERTRT